MKRSFLVLSVLISIFITMVSCKKEYVCRCTKIYTSGTGTNIQEYSLYPYTDTKNKAEDRCSTNNISSADFEGSYDINCQIQ